MKQEKSIIAKIFGKYFEFNEAQKDFVGLFHFQIFGKVFRYHVLRTK